MNEIEISKLGNLRAISPAENGSKNSMTEKASQPRKKVSEVFQKIQYEKMRFQLQKYEKYLDSKNDFKKLLGPFNKDL